MKKAKKKKNPRKYVVGYVGESQAVYGPDSNYPVNTDARWVDRMTMYTAMRRASQMSSCGHDVAIYELVPIVVGRVISGQFVPRKRGGAK